MNALREKTATTDEATERVTEIFDTTQPTDSATGTPPLLSRTTERRNATSSEQTREQSEATAKAATEADIGQNSTLDTSAQTTSEEESREESEGETRQEKGGTNPLVWVSLTLLVLAVAIIAITIKQHLTTNKTP
jgi:cobalamin biosynthesis Mg chelatase CobN